MNFKILFKNSSFLFLLVCFLGITLNQSHDIFSKTPVKNSNGVVNKISNTQLIDHHTHIFSPQVREYLVNNVEGLSSLPPLGLNKLIGVISKDSVAKAAVLSNAYFFSEAGKTKKEDFKKVQSENKRIAKAISKYPDKLVGFFSFNPLSDSAFAVIERNANRKVFTGIKLHLANSNVDLRKDEHVERLGNIFGKADSLGLGIVIHLRTQEKSYGRKDAQVFIDSVLSKAPNVPIQIAHMAGWGGYDPSTDRALNVFVREAQRGNLGDSVYFDISAVIRGVNKEQKKAIQNSSWYPENRYKRLVKQLRKLGTDKVLFGTDWPEWSPRDYKKDIKENLSLTKSELKEILTNRAPWFN